MAKRKEPKDYKGEFWYVNGEDGVKQAYIFVVSKKKPRAKIKLMAEYQDHKDKIIGLQYVVDVDSPEFQKALKEFGLTEKDRVVEKRSKKD